MKLGIQVLLLGILFMPAISRNCLAEERPRHLLTALSSTTIAGYVEACSHWETASELPGNENWQSGFVLPPGVDGPVTAFAVMGSNLYVGGEFERAGDLVVNGLAKWDGSNWHSVANGVHGRVNALAVSGTNLYVGGWFDSAGGIAATNVACWNGSIWQNIGDVTGWDYNSFSLPRVITLLASGRDLFVGGSFREAGGVSATNIARWDGTNWYSLGSGVGTLGGEVYAIAKAGSRLYAGGRFFDAGNVLATNIACWRDNQWRPLGQGLNGGGTVYVVEGQGQSGAVNAITVRNNSVYMGGSFNRAGKVKATNIARWRGGRWESVGRGIGTDDRTSGVNGILLHRGNVIISGAFNRAGKIAATNVVAWNGLRWRALGRGVNGVAGQTAFFNGQLYVGGDFGVAGQSSAANIAKWNGQSWSPLGEGIGNTVLGFVTTVAADAGKAYVSGYIHTAGTNRVKSVACWDGTNWSSLRGGIAQGDLWSSVASGTNFYLAGAFSMPQVGATNLARWNGLVWTPLGAGLQTSNGTPATIGAMTMQGGQLFVAGNFTQSSLTPVANVAVWNGSQWSAVGTNAPFGFIRQLPHLIAADAQNIFIVGIIRDGLGNYLNAVFRWDGINWTEIGRGKYASDVQSLAIFKGDLYMAGNFNDHPPATEWAGISTSKLARWNGAEWSAVDWPFGNGGYVPALGATDRFLYVGGQLGYQYPGIARFDGTNWFSYGSGVIESEGNGTVYSIAVSGNQVFVGGTFRTAGAKPSYRFAVWNEPQ
jgi:hypothetical protein